MIILYQFVYLFFLMFLKDVYAQQGCISLIKNTIKTVVLLNITTI